MNKPVLYIIILFFLLLGFELTPQTNLVYNGDFEIYDTCPSNIGQVDKCLGWWQPTAATSDYFNSCSVLANVPYSVAQYQYAHQGEGYCGFHGYSKIFPIGATPYLWVEYIESQLVVPLEKSHIYLVEFYLNASNYNNVANKNIGIKFFDTPFVSNNTLPVTIEPDISCNNYIIDTLNWVKIRQYYKATGVEKYLVIGTFYNNGVDTLMLEDSDPAFVSSYYLVDDVSVIETDISIPNVFTPNDDGINDFVDFTMLPNDTHVEIVNRWGNLVYSSNLDSKWRNNEGLVEGVYFYKLIDDTINKKITEGFIHLIK